MCGCVEQVYSVHLCQCPGFWFILTIFIHKGIDLVLELHIYQSTNYDEKTFKFVCCYFNLFSIMGHKKKDRKKNFIALNTF